MAAVNVDISPSLLTFRFLDADDEVVAYFKMNPADIKLAQRCHDLSSYFDGVESSLPENATMEDVIKINDELEEAICNLLGYDARRSLFGQISATSIMEDGNMFVVHVMNKIISEVEPVLKQRQAAMQAAAKHTAKYQ